MLKTTLIFCLGISLFSCSDMVTNQDQIEKNISQNQTLAKITSHDIFSYWDMDKWGSMKGTYLPYWHDMDFVNKPGISSSYPNYTWELTVYEGSIPYTSDRIALAQAITPYWNTYGGYPLRVGDYANLTSYKIRYYNNGSLDSDLTLAGSINSGDNFLRDQFMFYESSIKSFSGPTRIDLSSSDFINVVAKIHLPDEFRSTILVNGRTYPYVNKKHEQNHENELTYKYSYNISTDWIESNFLPWKRFPLRIKIIIDSRMFNRINGYQNLYWINNSDYASITILEEFR